jgi:hypothetical protein
MQVAVVDAHITAVDQQPVLAVQAVVVRLT